MRSMITKIRKSAKNEECTIQSYACNHNPETTVYCHLRFSWAGSGVGLKAHDIAGFYACSNCHDVIDNRVKSDLSKEEKIYFILKGCVLTWTRLIEKGVLK